MLYTHYIAALVGLMFHWSSRYYNRRNKINKTDDTFKPSQWFEENVLKIIISIVTTYVVLLICEQLGKIETKNGLIWSFASGLFSSTAVDNLHDIFTDPKLWASIKSIIVDGIKTKVSAIFGKKSEPKPNENENEDDQADPHGI